MLGQVQFMMTLPTVSRYKTRSPANTYNRGLHELQRRIKNGHRVTAGHRSRITAGHGVIVLPHSSAGSEHSARI